MVATISINELLVLVFSTGGIILLVFLGIAINSINTILKDVKYILGKNKNNINSTISSLPGIASKVKDITSDVRNGVQTIAATTETIEKKISKSSGSIVQKTDIAVDYVQVLSELVKSVITYLEKRK